MFMKGNVFSRNIALVILFTLCFCLAVQADEKCKVPEYIANTYDPNHEGLCLCDGLSSLADIPMMPINLHLAAVCSDVYLFYEGDTEVEGKLITRDVGEVMGVRTIFSIGKGKNFILDANKIYVAGKKVAIPELGMPRINCLEAEASVRFRKVFADFSDSDSSGNYPTEYSISKVGDFHKCPYP